MAEMIIKISLLTALYICLTAIVWYFNRKKELTSGRTIAIGIIFGISSIMSTHFGVHYSGMVVNVRDIGPLAAGLFFSPGAGVIAGLMGGIERYIAGTYFGIGSYTRIACSVSTCLAGFVAMIMKIKVFKYKKPSPFYAFFMGAVMEVFHMYVVFVTHRDDMRMAFEVVSICAPPMITFTGIGLALSAIVLQLLAKEWNNPFEKVKEEQVSLSQKFQRWLFVITSVVILGNYIFSFAIQTQTAYQNAKDSLKRNYAIVAHCYLIDDTTINTDSSVLYSIVNENGIVVGGKNKGLKISDEEYEYAKNHRKEMIKSTFWGVESRIYADYVEEGVLIIAAMHNSEVYWYRNAEAFEIAFADILLFTVIYVLIAYLVNQIVVHNIQLINNSLSTITNGNLNEVVRVRSSSEFASLSDDINQTVFAMKGYIDAAEKRIEQDLILARTIQDAALKQNFSFPNRREFEIYAMIKPAKEVGGDFYDFFIVDNHKMVLVIGDVADSGIPAALFMMRSKTAIRSFAEAGGTPEEILIKANNELYEGNDSDIFVTVWIGILDLQTGLMKCANAGHEYPVLKHAGHNYELIKDTHGLALATMSEIKPKPYEIQLHPGDKIFVYTDGITDTINDNNEQYGKTRMLKVLNEQKDKNLSDTLNAVFNDIKKFKGYAKQYDDITMLAFEFKQRSE